MHKKIPEHKNEEFDEDFNNDDSEQQEDTNRPQKTKVQSQEGIVSQKPSKAQGSKPNLAISSKKPDMFAKKESKAPEEPIPAPAKKSNANAKGGLALPDDFFGGSEANNEEEIPKDTESEGGLFADSQDGGFNMEAKQNQSK